MSNTIISNLAPGDGDKPIEIKVIRKWSSFAKRPEYCYIFIDRDGNAIQATGCLAYKTYFDSMIKVGACYCLSNYICEPGRTTMVVVPHTTGIRIGKATKFHEIPGVDFPAYYFNFLHYNQLSSRLNDPKILTDYIGKIEGVSDILRTEGTNIMKLRLENLSGTMIKATFWDDAAISFDKESVQSLPSPVIAVVTSMKVTQYLEILQLTATPASYIYINPTLPEATTMATEFAIRDNLNPILKVQYEKSKEKEVEMHRNRLTLAELLSTNPSRYGGVQFTCKAAMISVDETRGWFYQACDQCRKKLQKRGTTLACEDHDVVTKPKNLYFINAIIADDTAQAKIIFFDAAATMFLHTNCDTIIDELGYTDPYTLPDPINSLRGQTKVFQMRFSRFTKPGNIDFVGDAVFEDAIISDEETPQQANIIQPPNTITPDTPGQSIPHPVTSTPITPTSIPTAPPTSSILPASVSQPKQPKRSSETSAKKELFPSGASMVKKQKGSLDTIQRHLADKK